MIPSPQPIFSQARFVQTQSISQNYQQEKDYRDKVEYLCSFFDGNRQYRQNLMLLYEMGMTDCNANIEALKKSNNDLEAAISLLIT